MKKLLLTIFLITINLQAQQNKVELQLSTFYSQYEKQKPSFSKTEEFVKKNFEFSSMVRYESEKILIPVIVEFKDEKIVSDMQGLKLRSIIGKYATAEIDLGMLREVLMSEKIKYIELSKPLDVQLDVSSVKIRANLARDTYLYDGTGVIVGIIDTGIDFFHEDFIDEDGNTRILALWDQNSSRGTAPYPYTYGTLWNQTQINNQIKNPGQDIIDHKDKNGQGHGTHVSGIAVGNGFSSSSSKVTNMETFISGVDKEFRNGTPTNPIYVGIAPKANILNVAYRNTSDNVGYCRVGSSDIIDGINWVAEYAKSLNQPWVVNLSLGTKWGPKNGTSNFEKTISEIATNTSKGRGRIIVVSAGNEGYDINDPNRKLIYRWHADASVSTSRFMTIESNTSIKSEKLLMEIWYPNISNYSISLRTPTGLIIGPYSSGEGTGNTPGDCDTTSDGIISIVNNWYDTEFIDPFPEVNDNQILIQLSEDAETNKQIRNGQWEIIMSNGNGRWDAYIVDVGGINDPEKGAYFNLYSYSNERLITEPGNAYNVITVGSFNTKQIGINNESYPVDQISYFSSPGPTRDGRNKPDIFAPGAWIASSLSQYVQNPPANQLEPDGVHINLYGTSMAAPHVTGTVALLLQQGIALGKNFEYKDIEHILRNTKTTEGFLDVYDAISYVEGGGGMEDRIEITGPIEIEQGDEVTFNAEFFDDTPLGDSIISSWSWTLESNNSDSVKILASGSSEGFWTTDWTFTVPSLDGYSRRWFWDDSNNVMVRVKVKAKDTDDIWHEVEYNVGIPEEPNTPLFWRAQAMNEGRVLLSYIAGGAKNYLIYYDIDLGFPYSGTGANEGDSPIIIGADTTNLILSGLTNFQRYYFVVKAMNDYGESGYSDELNAEPYPLVKLNVKIYLQGAYR
ncbi:MAG: S8 family serine peptidase [Ignavibacteriales bacterium]|nr:S8 family serine peptidase [Ignavibacteriales bacterium]